MSRLGRHRPSPAMIVALIALFVAVGGTAWAVQKFGSKAIIDNSIKSRDIQNGGVDTKDLAAGSVTSGKLLGKFTRSYDAPSLDPGNCTLEPFIFNLDIKHTDTVIVNRDSGINAFMYHAQPTSGGAYLIMCNVGNSTENDLPHDFTFTFIR